MDPFILTIWYLVINCILFIFEQGFLWGLIISEVFLLFCLWTMDNATVPLGAVIIYLILWLIIVSGVYSLKLALLILLGYGLILVLPVVLWLYFH